MLGNLFSKEKSNIEVQHDDLTLDMTRVPHHVAIIMDGNGRWAKRRGMPRSAGHKAGADTLKQIIVAADELGVKVLTVYAFSTENWKRPEEEVSYIMNLMLTYLKKNLADLDHSASSSFIETRATVMLSKPPALLAKRTSVAVLSAKGISLVTISQISLPEIIFVKPSLLSRR
mgnify:CR=1 FL=1